MSIAQEHAVQLKRFQTHDEMTAALQERMDRLQAKRALHMNEDSPANILRLLEIDDEIYQLEKEINEHRTQTAPDYLLKVCSILQQYCTTGTSAVATDPTGAQRGMSEKEESFFDMNQFVQRRVHNNRGQLYSQYMNVVNNNPVLVEKHNRQHQTECADCGTTMQMAVNESYLVCHQCGNYLVHFEPSVAGLTYEQEIHTETNMHFSYKRINHLRELLSQLQAKESSDIPEDIIASVKAEFKKSRIYQAKDITQEKVKQFLKKLGYNRYYEHTRQITNILSGTPPPTISNALYDKIINMFIEIQAPFEQVCPKNRKNFFSYNYILYKFCELLDQKEHMKHFPLLKSREKLYQQDCIWKQICEIKGWSFIRSV